MSKKVPFLTEVALGVLITMVVALFYQKRSSLIETASLKTYDFLSKLRKNNPNTDLIHIIEIDDDAVDNLGRWPWPRSLVAQLTDQLVASGAKLIAFNIFYSEPNKSDGQEKLAQLEEKYASLLKIQRPVFQKKKVPLTDFEGFLEELAQAKGELNEDSALSQSIEESANIVLPMFFKPGDTLGNNLEALPAFFEKEKITLSPSNQVSKIPSGMAASLPLEEFGKYAIAIGHANFLPTDKDGTIRRLSPILRYGQLYFPSFAVQVVREYLNLQRNALVWKDGDGLSLFKAKIPLDEECATYIDYAGPAGTFKSHSALDVLSGGIPENALANKIVILGVTAAGTTPSFIKPGGESLTGLEIMANHIENILNQHFIIRPPWVIKAEWLTILLAGLVVIGALPFLRARVAIPVAAVVFAALIGLSVYLFVKQGIWLTPTYGLSVLISGFALLVGKRLIFTEKGKELVEAEGVETNKMLGLSFQGQGMLDLAFEKFRRCPMDDSMKDLLYNLGLDMERKRQFSKAAAVYEHISTMDTDFKDIKSKIDLLKKAGEGAVFGGIGKKGVDATVVVQGLSQNTTLGRYEVMKELGRGAMGIVYLGKDPKINRQVAIKTLRFEEEMDDEQAKSIKERFFREAESAGNLTHPNIIRIFDAGEDQEVAYIAMELLEGEDLKRFCEKANLFPLEKTLDIVIHVASGLDYAHKQGVVHRDIKPGNIMVLKDGTLRITDFGIARIQASSKTATGAVLGTPAYMSPEQVNGKKVDGRADIFSLGVTLYELLTGEKPFYADSIAALLYRIANVDHTNPREYRSDLPEDLIRVINKALEKDPEARYQKAEEMADDLKQCLKNLNNKDSKPGDMKKEIAKSEETPVVPPPSPNNQWSEFESITPPQEPTKVITDTFSSDLAKTFNLPPDSPSLPFPISPPTPASTPSSPTTWDPTILEEPLNTNPLTTAPHNFSSDTKTPLNSLITDFPVENPELTRDANGTIVLPFDQMDKTMVSEEKTLVDGGISTVPNPDQGFRAPFNPNPNQDKKTAS